MCNGSTPPARSYTTDELLSYNDGQTCQYIRRDVRKQLFKKRIFSPRYRHATPGLHRTVSSLPTVIGDVQITPSVEPVNESRVVSTGSVDSTEVQPRSPLHIGRESTHTPTRVRGRLFSASHCNINSNVIKLHSEIMFKLPQNNIND